MQVEIWSDIVCPWCYIGKRRFEMALSKFPQRDGVKVIWRSFELDPSSPPKQPGRNVELLARKYGYSLQQAAVMIDRVTGIAKEVGLEYRLFGAHPGNTFDGHRLLHFAASRNLGDRAIERIMHAYFCEELEVGDRAALSHLAPQFGLTENEVKAILESDAFSNEVRADERRAAELGITSVPHFLLNEKTDISGAQSVDVMVNALNQALK